MFDRIQMILMIKTSISTNSIFRLKSNASEILDIIYSGDLVPHITSLTRLTSISHTLIDNIMSNVITEMHFQEIL